MIYENFRVTGAHGAVLDFTNQFSIPAQSGDIQNFDRRWEQALLSTSEVSNDIVQESVYNMRIRECDQLQTVLAMYEKESTQDHRGQVIRRPW